MHAARLPLLGAFLGLCLLLASPLAARGGGLVLDGRKAPDFTFPDGIDLEAGTRLSSFRGDVVWIKFVLRDCPRCTDELPRANERHERWGGSGLVVLVVMHEHPPEAFGEAYARQGHGFRVGCDPKGAMARAYGVGRRPTDYVVGIDGRVVASNGAPDSVLRRELARRRVARIQPVPAGLEDVRDLVWSWEYGEALRIAAGRRAKTAADEDHAAFFARVERDATAELEGRIAYARRLAASERRARAVQVLDLLVAHFEGTALHARAKAARAALRARPDPSAKDAER